MTIPMMLPPVPTMLTPYQDFRRQRFLVYV
jgi:hypothetical protein